MILCDIGNTTFHFKSKTQDFKIFHNEKLPELTEEIFFLSVNNQATKRLLNQFPNSINIENIVQFNTSYEGMGIDRKVACLNIKDKVIIDAGSAITVDIIKDGIHKGGFILPGLSALKSIYPEISKELTFKFDSNINLNKIPSNTNDAINYAILQSIVSPIKNVSRNVSIIFTGGDGLLLSQYFEDSTYNKNLIFDNIKLLLDKMA